MKSYRYITYGFLLLLTCTFSISAHADDGKDKDSTKSEGITDKIKSSTKVNGMFTLYQDTATGSVQMYIEKDQLNQEFIYQSFSLGGPPQLFLNQNMIRMTFVFSIEKNYDKIEFIRENTSFYYEEGKAISKAKNADVSRANFFSTKIEAKDSTGYLISVDDLFFGQLMDPIKPEFNITNPSIRIFNVGNLNKGKSHYSKLRSYPDNTDVVVSLTFDNPSPKASGTRHVTDARYVEVKFQHTFLAMPKNDYRPRKDDPRVGYFLDQMENVTTLEYPRYHDQIHRWHLVKKDPTAALSEPIEPVVWWVENTTPEEYRDVILEAGRKWNVAFEKAGFKNAVVMKMMPDTASWDPADVRYNVIRWVSSDLGFAIGPSFVNPRTGQILGADITIDYGMLLHGLTEDALSNIGTEAHDFGFDKPTDNKHHYCTMAQEKRAQHGVAMAMMQAGDASDAELKRLVDQYITEIVLHEMGHTFGLAHNMKASQMLTLAEAHDTSITRKIGTTASIMDYTIANIHSNPAKQGDYYSTVLGPYDIWAIEYGYTPFTASEEERGLKAILKKSSDPKLDFGNDADILSQWSGIDPRVLTWDMSGDVVEYAIDRFEGINARVNNLSKSFVEDDGTYQKLYFMYYMMQRGRYSMSRAASRYIGGIYVNRNSPAEAGDTKPYTPVPESYQKEAMNFLSTYVFAPNAFDADKSLYPYLQRQRRGWNFGGNPEDPKIQSLVLGVQLSALSFIMNASTLHRINNSTLYGNTYTITEVMSDLTDACFSADLKGKVDLFRQNLQSSYVNMLIGAAGKAKGYDNASRATALSELMAVRKMIKKKGKDVLTEAHRERLRKVIDEFLDV